MPIRLSRIAKAPATGEPKAAPAKPHPLPFYTAADLARRWGMSERHVRRLIDAGDLIAHRFGRAVRVSLANVLIYEAGCIEVG